MAETVRTKINVMYAFIDGEKIECRHRNGICTTWTVIKSPVWDWSTYEYRVKKIKHTKYINIYSDGKLGKPKATRKDADDGCGMSRVACVKIEYYEGQYDD